MIEDIKSSQQLQRSWFHWSNFSFSKIARAEKCSRPWKMALKIFQEGKVSFSPHHKSNFWMAKIADALSPPLSARRNSRSRSRSQARQNMGFLWRCVEESSNHVLALVRWRAAKVHQRNMLMRCARKTQWGRDIKKVSLIYRWIPDTRWYPRDVPISEFLLF